MAEDKRPLEAPDVWETKTYLVLGMTYPVYSKKYTELVCTGAIEEDSGRLVRIHPLPKRYLDEEQNFKSFQRIEARSQRNLHDPRPESVRVDFKSLRSLNEIPARDREARRAYIERSPSIARSVEELHERNRKTGMSLGIVVPKTIERIEVRQRTSNERADWIKMERDFLSQRTLEFVRPPKRIDFPEAEFRITWTCDDPRCSKPHTSGLKSWSIHQLYRRLRADPERVKKTEDKLMSEFDLAKRDVFLFLGTFHNHQTTFGLMDAFRPPRREAPKAAPQLDLF